MYLASGGQNNAGLMGLSMPQDAPPPEQGQPPQQQGQGQQGAQVDAQKSKQVEPYTGTLQYKEDKIEVKNGIAEDDGQELNVFKPQGSAYFIVVGTDKKIYGIVDKDQVVPITPEITAELTKEGVTGGSKT